MRIAYCLPDTFHPGGIERITVLKANYLAEVYNYDVIIITSGQDGKEPFYDVSCKVKTIDLGVNHFESSDLSFVSKFIEKRKRLKKHKRQLKNVLLEIKADVVVSTFTHESSFLPAIKDGSKKVLEFHFSKGHRQMYARSFGFSKLTKLVFWGKGLIEENLIVNNYDQFVVLTEEDKKDWRTKCKKVIAIPNFSSFRPQEQADLNTKIVIAIGRLDPQKGFDRLIRIWSKLSEINHDWKLHIFGEGSYKKQLNEQIANLKLVDDVMICPPENDIEKRYLESSVFVMTSRYEGMPLTLLEASACGLPSVVYDFKCGPKDVVINEENGFIVTEGDELDFASKLSSLMSDSKLRQVMGKKAIHLSSKKSEKEIMKKWNDLFKHLLT